jgi:hypothetical protein
LHFDSGNQQKPDHHKEAKVGIAESGARRIVLSRDHHAYFYFAILEAVGEESGREYALMLLSPECHN